MCYLLNFWFSWLLITDMIRLANMQSKTAADSSTKEWSNMNLPSCAAVFPACPWPPPAPSGSFGHVCSFSWWWSEESPTHKAWPNRYKQQHKYTHRPQHKYRNVPYLQHTWWNHEPCQERRSSWPRQHSRQFVYVSSYPPAPRSSKDRWAHHWYKYIHMV